MQVNCFVICREIIFFLRFNICWNCENLRSICRDVYYAVSLFQRVYYQRLHCIYVRMHMYVHMYVLVHTYVNVYEVGHTCLHSNGTAASYARI